MTSEDRNATVFTLCRCSVDLFKIKSHFKSCVWKVETRGRQVHDSCADAQSRGLEGTLAKTVPDCWCDYKCSDVYLHTCYYKRDDLSPKYDYVLVLHMYMAWYGEV